MQTDNEIMEGMQEAAIKYQEILIALGKGKMTFMPDALLDWNKTIVAYTQALEQVVSNPEKFINLNASYVEKFQNLVSTATAKYLGHKVDNKDEYKGDKRFNSKAWEESIYFDFIKQFYLLCTDCVDKNIKACDLNYDLKRHLQFIVKQFVNAVSPSNFIFTNPEVLQETIDTKWKNIVQGLNKFLQDVHKGDVFNLKMTNKDAFKFGENIAVTQGKIVFENALMQLICYEPKSKTYRIPICIVPAWINKYYILDLSPANSMVQWLVNNNFQVFIISWINPNKELADINFEDYLRYGILDAHKYIRSLGYDKINFAGYCLGGTLLASSAAYMKANGIEGLNSLSFLTTLLDFKDPGELGVFVNESSVKNLENEMQKFGFCDGRYLLNSFSLLRSNDLIWSYFINNYLLAKEPMALDLLYWNSDPTNLPAKMQSYYLRNMYLENLLVQPGKLQMLGTSIDLGLIEVPSYFLATHDDHIAPWQSVYNGIKFLNCDKVFCLGGSGHVAGVINHPEKKKYGYKVADILPETPDDWLLYAKETNGSWWNHWHNWLISHSGKISKSIDYVNLISIEPAPGSYVKTCIM